MAVNGSGLTSNAGRIADRISAWPGVTRARADCGVGVALVSGGRQIMHLHGDDEAELRLTRAVVDRLGCTLAECERVEIRPGGEWITVRLDTDSDVALVVSLASVAIKATATDQGPAPCGVGARRTGTLRGLASSVTGQ
ncbi:luciferase family protein [Spirillospora sp. CA-294931]|uniref:luciferase domain-containing protein n=1 Tax=Spirillospora sp. CA-294931 TaxID=3240042 RepID=UPI003D91052B